MSAPTADFHSVYSVHSVVKWIVPRTFEPFEPQIAQIARIQSKYNTSEHEASVLCIISGIHLCNLWFKGFEDRWFLFCAFRALRGYMDRTPDFRTGLTTDDTDTNRI